MNYPIYARDEKKSVKLTTDQVEQLRDLHKSGFSIAELAERFDVSHSGVRYQLMTDEQRAEKNKKRAQYKKTYNPEVHRRFLDNKLEANKEGVLAYRRGVNAKFRESHREELRIKGAEWARNNRKSRAKVAS